MWRIHREAGDRIPPDELLVEIDPTDSRLAAVQAENNLRVELAKLGLQGLPDSSFDLSNVPTVMLAQARLENTQAKLERTRRLAAENAASKGDLENAVSEFRTAQADRANQILLAKSILATIQLRQSALAIANQQLADTQIRVPRPQREVPGLESNATYVVTKRSVAEGAFVRAGDEVYTLAIDKTLKLRVPVPERFSAQIKSGQKSSVFIAAFSEPFSGKVSLVHPVVSPTTRTFEVEIQIANDKGLLKPGSFAKAIIETNQTEDAPKLRQNATPTKPGLFSIVGESVNTALQAKLEGELTQLFLLARYTNATYRLAGIPQDYQLTGDTMSFDPKLMRGLFDEGYRGGRAGTTWQSAPPGLDTRQVSTPRTDTRFTTTQESPSSESWTPDKIRITLDNSPTDVRNDTSPVQGDSHSQQLAPMRNMPRQSAM